MNRGKVLTDDSIMSFGKYRGEKLANVPASYLIYLYNEGLDRKNLKNYIEDNFDVLKVEVNREEKKKEDDKIIRSYEGRNPYE